MKQIKKTEDKIEVDMDFLIKMATQIDNLTAKVRELEKKPCNIPDAICENIPNVTKMDYKIQLQGTPTQDVRKVQTEFLAKVWELLKAYNISEFKADFKK